MTEKRAYTLPEVQELTGIRVNAIKNRLSQIPHRRLGNKVIVMTLSDIDALLEAMAVKPSEPVKAEDPEVARMDQHKARVAERLRRGRAA